jgi:hypothetical protein
MKAWAAWTEEPDRAALGDATVQCKHGRLFRGGALALNDTPSRPLHVSGDRPRFPAKYAAGAIFGRLLADCMANRKAAEWPIYGPWLSRLGTCHSSYHAPHVL